MTSEVITFTAAHTFESITDPNLAGAFVIGNFQAGDVIDFPNIKFGSVQLVLPGPTGGSGFELGPGGQFFPSSQMVLANTAQINTDPGNAPVFEVEFGTPGNQFGEPDNLTLQPDSNLGTELVVGNAPVTPTPPVTPPVVPTAPQIAPIDPTNVVLDTAISDSLALSDAAKAFALQFINAAYSTPGDETVLQRIQDAIASGGNTAGSLTGQNQGDAQSAINYLYGITTQSSDPSNDLGNTFLTATIGFVNITDFTTSSELATYATGHNNPVVADAINPDNLSSPFAAVGGILEGRTLGSDYLNTATHTAVPPAAFGI